MSDPAPPTGPTPADPFELSAETWELLQEAMANLQVDNPDFVRRLARRSKVPAAVLNVVLDCRDIFCQRVVHISSIHDASMYTYDVLTF